MVIRLVVISLLTLQIEAQIKQGPRFRTDDPISTWPEPAPVQHAKARRISDIHDYFLNTFTDPTELHRKPAGPQPGGGTNTIGEVPDGSWYESRHYKRRMTLEELTRGPGSGNGPRGSRWQVVAGKTEGITPGITIRDEQGQRFLLKFDPMSNPEMATGAEAVSTRFFHALGYHVPGNTITFFKAANLEVDPKAWVTDATGKRRPMERKHLDVILSRVPRTADGRIRALASRYLDGVPLGPRRFHGTRHDDPNDIIPHENRRDLRGLRVFSAWLDHDDSRAINSLDMLDQRGTVPFVKHYLIDFGSTLGSASTHENSPRSGFEPLFSWKSGAAELFSLGLYVPGWARARYPQIPSVGRFEYERFDPVKWRPEFRNPAFENMLPGDSFWAARQVAHFTDDEIHAIVGSGQYSDPQAASWITRCLIERRNKIVQQWLSSAVAADHFRVENRRLTFTTLAGTRTPDYSISWRPFDNSSGQSGPEAGKDLTLPDGPPEQWWMGTLRRPGAASVVHIYVRPRSAQASYEVVGLERP